MPAGTIALTNGSATVTGTSTVFTTEFKIGDFLGVIVGGVPYTLIVSTITSDTSLTIVAPFTGPTTSGLAWYAVPATLQTAITQQAMNNMSKILTGMIQDKANWQQVFSGSGTITVKLPDGSTYSGPAWSSITNSLAAKMDKSQNLADLTDITAARTNLKLGASSAVTFGGMELSSATPYIDFHFNNTTDDYNVRLINDKNGVLSFYGANGIAMLLSRLYFGSNNQMAIRGATSGTTNYLIAEGGPFYASIGYRTQAGTTGAAGSNAFNFYWTGGQLQSYIDSSSVGFVTMTSSSDKELKKDIAYREDAAKGLEEVLQWRPADFKMKARGIVPETSLQLGFIANDLVAVSPECVSGVGLPEDYDIEADPNNSDAYYLNHIPMIAKLAQAVQVQQTLIESQNSVIAELQKRMKAIDGLDQ